MHYEKLALTYEQQLALLGSRGLRTGPEGQASHWLEHIGYYRLSAYFGHFKTHADQDRFLDDAALHQVLDLYRFDERLRVLISNAIGAVEVSARARLTYRLAHDLGPFGYTNPGSFLSFAPSERPGLPPIGFDHGAFLEKLRNEIRSSKEEFVAHYFGKYTSEPHLPIWMATELLTFGTISKMVAGLPKGTRKQLARTYGVSASQYVSWLRCLAYIRNICAHHGRLWNRQLSVRPELLAEWDMSSGNPARLYSVCLVLDHLLKRIDRSFRLVENLGLLFGQHPGVNFIAMGFPPGWRERSPWAPTASGSKQDT
jgi:abortive infection bacteriophage resistance protein